MPELPEVEVIRRDLAPRVVGRRIAAAAIRTARLTRRQGSPASLQEVLVGRRVLALRRRGKVLHFDLGDLGLLVRLGMTGQFCWWATAAALASDRHTHAVLYFAEGGVLSYRDPRTFGEWFVLPSERVEATLGLGPEPLEAAFTAGALKVICRGPTRIKPLLLDQRRVAGIGNIYADEALFRAGIRPTRRARTLTGRELERLRSAIRQVLRAGIRHRGSSIADFRDPDGAPGGFQPLHRVYQRQGQPCLVCGTAVRRILLAQRGTHYCPRCQR